MANKDPDLFDRLRQAGLRKQAAKTLSEVSESAGKKAERTARAAVKELRALADEIERRLPAATPASDARGAKSTPSPRTRTSTSRTTRPSTTRTKSASAKARSAAAAKPKPRSSTRRTSARTRSPAPSRPPGSGALSGAPTTEGDGSASDSDT
ncbi:MAG: hypothetical protein ACXVH3_33575 [Solirubrobacteraceae bacterium]